MRAVLLGPGVSAQQRHAVWDAVMSRRMAEHERRLLGLLAASRTVLLETQTKPIDNPEGLWQGSN
jgi:hypothetical protein